MNFLTANTTNHRRAVMMAATLILDVFIVLVFYKSPLTFREFIFPPIVGLLIFEFLFRTRKYLKPITLPLYIIIVTIVGELLYGLLYSLSYGGGWSPFSSIQYLFSEFPYNLYVLIEYSILTGLAYYLIKIYRNQSWIISESVTDASNEPIFDEGPLTLNSWLRKNSQQLIGFFAWYLVNGLVWVFIGNPNTGYNIITNLFVFPINLLALIILSAVKRTRKIGFGILIALAVNLLLSLLLGLIYNGLCFIPFFWR